MSKFDDFDDIVNVGSDGETDPTRDAAILADSSFSVANKSDILVTSFHADGSFVSDAYAEAVVVATDGRSGSSALHGVFETPVKLEAESKSCSMILEEFCMAALMRDWGAADEEGEVEEV